MLQQIEKRHPSPRFYDPIRRSHCPPAGGVMQRLAEERKIDDSTRMGGPNVARRYSRLEAMPSSQRPAEFHHLLGVVYGNDLFRTLGEHCASSSPAPRSAIVMEGRTANSMCARPSQVRPDNSPPNPRQLVEIVARLVLPLLRS
jgi:hypothetical protein